MFAERPLSALILSAILIPSTGAWAAPGSASPDRHELARDLRRIESTVLSADVFDAKRQRVRGLPWARVDVRDLELLDEAIEAPTLEEARSDLRTFLESARRGGLDSAAVEMRRLDARQLDRLAERLDCQAETAPLRCVMDRFETGGALGLDLERQSIARLDDPQDVAGWVGDLQHRVLPSIKTRGKVRRRVLTFPAFPFVWAWKRRHVKNEYEGPQPIEFAEHRVYRPVAAAAHSGDAELLARHAPLLVQELDPEADYAPEVDRLGAFRIDHSDDLPEIDVSQPVSYAYIDQLPLRDRVYRQLVYTFWYPEHPELKGSVDAEAGKIEGITLRITLDSDDRPRLFETVYNCGCGHRLFVDRSLEADAADEFGPPEETRAYSIQRHVPDKIDWIVPELVEVDPAGRPILYVRAGFHMPATVKYTPPWSLDLEDGATYEIRDYASLEAMPLQNGEYASIFDETGLVRGAKRLESALLTPLGLYHAGQPRQRGTQLIHFDQADLDDPALFEEYLRLPSSF